MATTRRTATQGGQKRGGENSQDPWEAQCYHYREDMLRPVKRAADEMAPQNANKKTRAAFGDITNASKFQKEAIKAKKQTIKAGGKKKSKVVVVVPKPKKTTTTTSSQEKAELSWDVIELSQESHTSSQSSQSLSQNSSSSENESMVTLVDLDLAPKAAASDVDLSVDPTKDYDDVDTENLSDPFQVAVYAKDIFDYYKEREAKFVMPDFMQAQMDLTPHMRTILVDWLVEVQENFELNHETLYLAVKLVDLYLCNKQVARDRLQLVGATALFIACKFDERCPPVLDDFLYICDDAYKREEIIRMEMELLRSIDFDLGIPLSYRFLRRYSKCARAAMETLTLGRYILERSLMDYRFTQQADSKMAAAALLLSLTLRKAGSWDGTLVHYTGYQKEELLPLVVKLNKMISSKPHKNLTTIFSKYSHKVFHEVAKCTALDQDDLIRLGVTAEMTDANLSSSSLSSSPSSSDSS